jgi:hypothetical protein
MSEIFTASCMQAKKQADLERKKDRRRNANSRTLPESAWGHQPPMTTDSPEPSAAHTEGPPQNAAPGPAEGSDETLDGSVEECPGADATEKGVASEVDMVEPIGEAHAEPEVGVESGSTEIGGGIVVQQPGAGSDSLQTDLASLVSEIKLASDLGGASVVVGDGCAAAAAGVVSPGGEVMAEAAEGGSRGGGSPEAEVIDSKFSTLWEEGEGSASQDQVTVPTQSANIREVTVSESFLCVVLNGMIVRVCCYSWRHRDNFTSWLRPRYNIDYMIRERYAQRVLRDLPAQWRNACYVCCMLLYDQSHLHYLLDISIRFIGMSEPLNPLDSH